MKYFSQVINSFAFIAHKEPTTGPIKVQWDLLMRCNSRCIMCDRWDKQKFPDRDLLPRERILEVVDEMAAMDVMSISLSGGEVFLRKDILDIVRHIRKRGINTLINTNGLLVTESLATEIASSGLNEIIFSIDSAKADLHDRIRGVPGNFKRVIKAIRHCVAARGRAGNKRLKISANSTLCDWNAGEFADILSLVDTLSMDSLTISPVHTIDHMGFNPQNKMSLSPEGIHRFLASFQRLPARLRNLMPFQDTYFHNFSKLVNDPGALKGYHCTAGHLTLQIHPNGDVHPCIMAFRKLGNLKQHSLKDILRSEAAREVRRDISRGRHPICWYSCIAPITILIDDFRHARVLEMMSPRTLKHVFSRMRP